MTDAYIPNQNDTDSEKSVDKKIHVSTYTNTANQILKEERNNSNNSVEDTKSIEQTNLETKVEKVESNGNITRNIQLINVNGTESNNICTKNNTNATRENDTVLNYVYKKDDDNLSHKLKGHPKNSIHRKKRSTDNYGDHVRYAASAPLIVSYKTIHYPRHIEPLALSIPGVIQNAQLADFNIETLHEDQPAPDSEKIKDHFRKKYNQKDYPPKSTEKSRDNNDRDNYSKEKKIPYKASDESNESSNFKDRKPQYNQDSREKSRREDTYSDSNESGEKIDYREKGKASYQNQDRSAENDNRKGSDSSGNDDSSENGRYTDQEDKHSDESKENDQKKNGPYRGSRERADYRDSNISQSGEDYNSGERGDYREKPSANQSVEDSREHITRKKSDSNESDEKSNYREKEFPHRSHNDYGSYEKDYPPKDKSTDSSNEKDFSPVNKATYSLPSKDSNESRESDEPYSVRTPGSQESEEKNYHNAPKSAYTKPRNDDVDSRENEEYKNSAVPLYQDVPPINSKNIYVNNDSKPKRPLLKDDDESEEEEIIIMTKKKRKNNYGDKYSAPKVSSYKASPSKIQEVDLGDFSYERIKVNDKSVVEPIKETYGDYDVDNKAEISPLTTFKPEVKETETPLSSRITDSVRRSTKNPIILNDGEVKPVVELHGDKDNLNEENGKQDLKDDTDENQSLESILGVQESIEQGGKIVEESVETDNGDIKQQFERIPFNYNHSNQKQVKEHTKENINAEPITPQTITELSPSAPVPETDDNLSGSPNDGILEITTPQKYDEKLNIKFDDTPIKLPEIKLPDDVLSYIYEEPEYDKKQNKQNKFYTYDNAKKIKDDYDDFYDEHHSPDPHHSPPNYYGHVKEKDQYRKRDKEDDDHYQPSFYGLRKEKDEYREEKKQNPDYDDEGVDLYEKFVRERFGKRGSFEKRSANLAENPTLGDLKLHGNLQQVLKKTENIEKEAVKSGDPKAGYMWTLEYGQNL